MASTSAVRFQRDRQDLGQPWKGWRAALTDCAGFTQGPWFASPAPPRHTGSSLPARYPAPVLSYLSEYEWACQPLVAGALVATDRVRRSNQTNPPSTE